MPPSAEDLQVAAVKDLPAKAGDASDMDSLAVEDSLM